MLWVLKSLVVICWWCCNLGVFGKVNLSFAREQAKISVGELGYACDPSGGEWEDMQNVANWAILDSFDIAS